MSAVKEIHERLKKIDESKYYPPACIDLAEKLIRHSTRLEFNVTGTIELAWRRGFQAGLESRDLSRLNVLDELIEVLEAIARKPTLVVMEEDMVMAGDLTENLRQKAYEILVIVRNLDTFKKKV